MAITFLQAEDISKSFGIRNLFSDINLTIEEGQKIALIARNGAGKTTLFNILAGKDTSDTGSVWTNKDIRMAYLPQEPDLINNKSVLENILSENNPISAAIRKYEHALAINANENSLVSAEMLSDAMAQMDIYNAWDYEQNIAQILTRLKISNMELMPDQLSGGQKKRVALAKILIEEPEFILMDEPTNHLDIEMIEWLEGYLNRSRLTYLLITHNRYFLYDITNEILELDQGKLFKYKGNYENYLEKKTEREELADIDASKNRNLLKKELEWIRKQPRARGTKAKYRVNAFYDLKEKAQQPLSESEVSLNAGMQRLGKKILECHNLSKKYAEKVILDDFNYLFQKGERLGIVGDNGTGKSTFLNIITGNDLADSGYIDTGETVVFGYYKQTGLKLPEEKRVIEVVQEIAEVIQINDKETLSATQLLQQFGFTPQKQYTYVSTLSGGEKRRLYLLTILVRNPNFLILDEPTNDLDILTLNTLENYLMQFKGCLIIVTHDRYFLNKLANHLFIFKGDGNILDFNGLYLEYREYLREEDKLVKNKSTGSKPQIKEPPSNLKRKATFNEKREFELLESEIKQLEDQKLQVQQKMAIGNADHQEWSIMAEELKQIESKLAEKSDRWLELSDII
jgi:ATP-binding cassette subfamily F protein uup